MFAVCVCVEEKKGNHCQTLLNKRRKINMTGRPPSKEENVKEIGVLLFCVFRKHSSNSHANKFVNFEQEETKRC